MRPIELVTQLLELIAALAVAFGPKIYVDFISTRANRITWSADLTTTRKNKRRSPEIHLRSRNPLSSPFRPLLPPPSSVAFALDRSRYLTDRWDLGI